MSTSKRIIVFAGKKGSGKTTAADIVTRDSKGRVLRLHFASLYKNIAHEVGFSDAELYGGEKEHISPLNGVSAREFLCLLGDFFRYTLPEKTTRRWLSGSSNALTNHILLRLIEESYADLIIIDDLRYLEEYEALERLGSCEFYFITRPALTESNEPPHRSETDMHTFANKARWIVNDGPLPSFVQKITNIIA
jgi:hypothetical protein